MSGRVVHFEIPVDDAERAQAFYRQAFGWELTSLPGMDYTLAVTGPTGDEGPTEPGYVNGGFLPRGTDHEAPVIVIDVADIDAALAKIEELGGRTVVGRQQVGDLGWTAYFRDAEGNHLGLWQSA
jgi:predicted enzyme related to lactoylglutathione lyase